MVIAIDNQIFSFSPPMKAILRVQYEKYRTLVSQSECRYFYVITTKNRISTYVSQKTKDNLWKMEKMVLKIVKITILTSSRCDYFCAKVYYATLVLV